MNFWLVLGFTGQALFASRFIVQWICSERRGESYIPIVFWYLSLAGGAILLIYAISIKDPVFIVGQSTGVIVYLRNLVLISRNK
ncbi:MAG: lipid-A-disaccharide synthase N-terminal domain-containing protein [Candidatus Omnitrophica bacterium]|nr:lipid-A-disaccharide synthase N-terminal domain-containing protein [Candidatus Omnitrophota bacterium]